LCLDVFQVKGAVTMLTYEHPRGLRAIRILFILHGSCFPRSSCVAVVPTALSVVLSYAKNEEWKYFPEIAHPFAAQVFAIVLGFAIVFRTNMALGRYWEGVTNVEQMTSKWCDSYMQLCNYINATIMRNPGNEEALERLSLLRETLAHWYTLMGAVAICHLRAEEVSSEIPRIFARPFTAGDHLNLIMKLPTAKATPAGEKFYISKVTKSYVCKRSQDERKHRLRFPETDTQNPESPRGSDLSLRMPEGLSNNNAAKGSHTCQPRENSIPVQGGKSPSSSSSSRWFSFFSTREKEEVADGLEVLGPILQEEAEVLDHSTDKVIAVAGWISQLLTEFVNRDWIACPPPVLSRVYQETSHGLLAYNQACKVTLVPFPFPFTQMLQLLLLVFLILVPVVVVQFTYGYVISAALTFVVTMGYWSLNEICAELENPYGEDPNDLPLLAMHTDFVDTVHSMMMRSADVEDPFARMVAPLFAPIENAEDKKVN